MYSKFTCQCLFILQSCNASTTSAQLRNGSVSERAQDNTSIGAFWLVHLSSIIDIKTSFVSETFIREENRIYK